MSDASIVPAPVELEIGVDVDDGSVVGESDGLATAAPSVPPVTTSGSAVELGGGTVSTVGVVAVESTGTETLTSVVTVFGSTIGGSGGACTVSGGGAGVVATGGSLCSDRTVVCVVGDATGFVGVDTVIVSTPSAAGAFESVISPDAVVEAAAGSLAAVPAPSVGAGAGTASLG